MLQPVVPLMSDWVCKECENENPTSAQECEACGEARPAASPSDASANRDDAYFNIVVGVVKSIEPVPNKDKLLLLSIDVGGDVHIPIVTNATNVTEGAHVVVAKVGATINDTVIKKANVGGTPSEGMLCDAPMLNWVGGGAGAAAIVPSSFTAGSRPPETRPRLK
jgi:tRNA-binding EMAP/Myf-like protein